MFRIFSAGGCVLIGFAAFATVTGYSSDSQAQARGEGSPPLGYYACNFRGRFNPNFSPTLLAGGRYRVTYNIGGKVHDSNGSYSYDPGSKLVRFKGGEFNGLTAFYGITGTALSANTQTLDWPTLIWPKSDGTYPYGMYCPNKGTQNPITQTR